MPPRPVLKYPDTTTYGPRWLEGDFEYRTVKLPREVYQIYREFVLATNHKAVVTTVYNPPAAQLPPSPASHARRLQLSSDAQRGGKDTNSENVNANNNSHKGADSTTATTTTVAAENNNNTGKSSAGHKGRSESKQRLLSEAEWRGVLGLQMSAGWKHYMVWTKEPNILLFQRPVSFNTVSHLH